MEVVNAVDGDSPWVTPVTFVFFKPRALGLGRTDLAGVGTVRPRFEDIAGSSSLKERLAGTRGAVGDESRGSDVGAGWSSHFSRPLNSIS